MWTPWNTPTKPYLRLPSLRGRRGQATRTPEAMLVEEVRQEIRDLWSTVDELRSAQHLQNTMLAEIKTLLSERCMLRGREVDTLAREMRDMRQRVWTFSGAAAVLAILAQRLLHKIWP